MTFGHCPPIAAAGLCVSTSTRCLLASNAPPALLRPVCPAPTVPRKPVSPQLRRSLSRPFDPVTSFPGSRRPGRRRHRRCLFPTASSSSSLELPLLPFNMNEVLVPSETKTLHLYEARYLALLEEVERLDVGALVSIRGVGRVKLLNFIQAEPYLKGLVIPVQDSSAVNTSETSSKVDQLKESLCNLIKLEIKLKAPKEALLQTHTANSLRWAENTPSVDCDESFIPSLAERVSFAALQPVSGSTESELFKLQQEKLRAMDTKETLERLEDSLVLVKENISIVAAKLAIQSLEM